MKKAFCFSLIVMFIALAGLTPVKADDVAVITPYVDSPTLTDEQIFNLENASLLLEYLRKGGTIDVKNTSSDYSADDLLSDFGNFVRDVVGEFIDIVNPFQTEIEYHGLQPISPAKSAVIQFMGALPFYALQNTDNEPTPEPPIEYNSYIDYINGSGFFFKNWNNGTPSQGQINEGFTTMQNYYPNGNYSWFCHQLNVDWGINNSNLVVCSDIKTVNIYSIDDVYYMALPVTALPAFNAFYASDGHNLYVGQLSTSYLGQTNIISSRYTMINNSIYNNTNKTYTYQCTGTLVQCLDYVKNNMKNVNIYVDGVPWSIVGEAVNNYQIEISTGTTVPIKDGTGKVEWLYDYEIYFDIDRIQDDLNTLLNYIRNNPQSPTIIKFDDLEDVIVDVDGQPALAVKVLADTRNIDEIYIANYGPIIPAFLPLFTPVIDDVDIITIADTAVSPIPDDLLEVFGYMFMGVLFVGFIHRLLE